MAGEHVARIVTRQGEAQGAGDVERADEVGVEVGGAVDAARLVGVVLVPLSLGVPKATLRGESALQLPGVEVSDFTLEVEAVHLGAVGVFARLEDLRDATDHGVLLRKPKGVHELRVEAFGQQVELPNAEAVVPVDGGAEAVRGLLPEARGVARDDEVATGVVHVQVLVKELRGAEALAVAGAQGKVFRGGKAQVEARAEDGAADHRVLVESGTDEDAPAVVFPFVLQEGALRVHALIDGRLAVSALIVQVIVIVLDARGERGGEEEQAVKVSGILCAEHVGQAVCASVRRHALVQLQHILVRQAVVRAG